MCCLRIAAPPRAFSGCKQSPGSFLGNGYIGPAELSEVAGGLLEVVAENLIQLYEGLTVFLEPPGEAPVKVGASRLRERVVGGVPDQEVTEAVRLLARQHGAVGPDEVAAHERR
jgi:hypothetical protein